MTGNQSLRRKVIYIVVIVLLLIPLHWLGQPSTARPGQGNDSGTPSMAGDERVSPGGRLAQLRLEHGLAQAELGEIDPTSESMKLATLGFRGVAANLLWSRSNEYKKTEQWHKLKATLDQIVKLQPNFYEVWEFQAHNLSYNVSVEFDDYRYRYHWVKKGIDFLMQGTHYNKNEPRLYYKLGWFMGQKIGRADEAALFRNLFRDDQDFHDQIYNQLQVDVESTRCAPPPRNKPDNWLVGEQLYDEAYRMIDAGAPLRGYTRHLFFNSGPLSFVNYATTMAQEGWFDMSVAGWKNAETALTAYGDREFPTSWGTMIKFNHQDEYLAEASRLAEKIDALAPPNLRQELRQAKIDKLSADDKLLLDKVPQSEAELRAIAEVEDKVKVRHDEVALKVDRPQRNQALRYARQAMLNEAKALHTERYRFQANYDYWIARCQAEQRTDARMAREMMHEADEKKEEAELAEARRLYEQAWKYWHTLYKDYPVLLDDPSSSDVTDAVGRYLDLLELEGADVPDDFPLVELLRYHRDDIFLNSAFRGRIDELIQREEARKKQPPPEKTENSDPPPDADPVDPSPALPGR
jgi:hypothetical protein